MEVFLYIFAVFISIAVLFLIVEHPYYIAGIVIFMVVYRFNIATPLPLDARGLLTLVLFIRLYIFDKDNAYKVNNYLWKNKTFLIIALFSVSVLILPSLESEKITKYVKDIILNIVVLIIGFLTLSDNLGKKVFLYSVLSVSFFSTVDLFYTNLIGGGLNVVRVLEIYSGQGAIPVNHNFPGMLATLGIFFVYLMYSRNEGPKFLLLVLGLLFTVALLLSTSRSALLALIVVFALMNFWEIDLRANIKKFIFLGGAVFVSLIVFFFMYNLFLKTNSKDQFIDKVYYRLYDEPLQMIGLIETNRFDIYSHKKREGSMKFRAEKWEEDFGKFRNLNFTTIALGVGAKKYSEIAETRWGVADNSKGSYAAHNGYLIILVERGILGLLLYVLILLTLSVSSFKIIKEFEIKAPVIYLFLFIAVYSFAQNSELVGVYAFLLMGGILGNVYSCSIVENKIKEN